MPNPERSRPSGVRRRRNLAAGAFAALLAALFSIGGLFAQPAARKYLVDVRLPSLEVARELQQAGFDVAGINRAESTAGVVVTDEGLARLRALGYAYTVRESTILGESITALQDYTDPQELSAYMDQVVSAHPDLAMKITLKDTLFEGQRQYALKITKDVGVENERPVFILDAQHHAREVMTTEIARDMIDYLTSRYATDSQVRRWVDNVDIYVVGSVNPDGAMYVFQSDNMWRKNRRPACPVDVNRNYPFAWGSCNGSSADCSAETTRGIEPGSEPETQGMLQLTADVRPFYTLSYHTYGEYLMYPYGCTNPDEMTAMDEVARSLNGILQNDNGQTGQYAVGPIWSTIYLVDGGSIDSQYALYGAYGFTIEANCCSFQPDYATWRNVTVQRQRTAWQFFLDRTLDGPQIRGKVTDAVTGHPIAAQISVQELTFSHGESPRRADAHGQYHWLARSGQTYHLNFTMAGYCPITQTATVGSGPTTLDAALVPPTPPVGVAAAGNGDNRIDVSWSPALNAVEYRVLRSLTSGGPYTQVGTVTVPGTIFQDTTVSGGAVYYYVVRAMQPCDSGNSAEASASTTGTCFVGPAFAGLSSVTNSGQTTCSLDLAWPSAAARCGGFVTYQVYRSTSAPFTPSPSNLIASGLGTTQFSDHAALANGTTYFYIVRAVDSKSGVSDGNSVALSGIPAGPTAAGTWTDDAGDTGSAKLAPTAPWSVQPSGGRTGPKVYATGPYTNNLCSALVSPILSIQTGSVLSFAAKYDIETDWDAGIVEVAEGPAFSTWSRLATVNYPDTLNNTGNACGFPKSFSGTVFSHYHSPASYSASPYSGSLAAYAGKQIQLRWRLSSDGTGTGAGWWVDDLSVTNAVFQQVCSTGTTPTPTEASPAGSPMIAVRAASGTGVDLSYTPGCGTTDNAIYWGTGPIVGSPLWTHVACSVGNTRQASFDPGLPPAGGVVYFVIVGQNSAKEGSYGRSFDGTVYAERAEASGLGVCDLPQDLTGICP